MPIKEACSILKDMEAEGIIKRYALAGAVAAYVYVEAVSTEDLDALVAFASEGVGMLAPLWAFLRERGYTELQGGVVVGGWAVEFLPVGSALDAEALEQAQDVELEPWLTVRVLRAEHLVATALSVGRPKDHIRIVQFLEEGAVDPTRLCPLLDRHGLADKWRAFCVQHGIANPCAARSKQPDPGAADVAAPAAGGTTTAHPYPHIMAAHLEARRKRAALSFAAKIAGMERIRDDIRLLKAARRASNARRTISNP